MCQFCRTKRNTAMDIKNIIIPTDFSLYSLDFAAQIAQAIPEKHNIFLFHAFDMPDSLLDAMKRVGQNSHSNLITEELRIRCKQIKTKHKSVSNICFRIMYGTTIAAFRNLAEADRIDMIVLPTGYRFAPVVRESVNPERMFKKSGIEVIEGDMLIQPSITHSVKTKSIVIAN